MINMIVCTVQSYFIFTLCIIIIETRLTDQATVTLSKQHQRAPTAALHKKETISVDNFNQHRIK